MNQSTHPLPNSADAQALKALATTLITTCPDLHETASEVAKGILLKHGITHLEPEQVYWNRFGSAISSSVSFTGWEHWNDTPYESLTLPELLIQRFSVHDQDNADLLHLYGGFYTLGVLSHPTSYDHTNEVRLDPNQVLNDFWDLNFSDYYLDKLNAFWRDHSEDFRALAKCTFLTKALQSRDDGHLSNDDLRTAIAAVASNIRWPVDLAMLRAEAPPAKGLSVRALDIAGYTATDILRIVDQDGRQMLYIPGDEQSFHVFETPNDLHWWLLMHNTTAKNRPLFMAHFSLADQQSKDTKTNLNHMIDLLYSTWGVPGADLVNQRDQPIEKDPFTHLCHIVESKMRDTAQRCLTSNGDLRKQMWIGYLGAAGRLFGPLAPLAWPVALLVVGAGVAYTGLNIDQAVNAKTPGARKAAVIASILGAIDTLFNSVLLFTGGRVPDIVDARELEAAEKGVAEETSVSKPRPIEEPLEPAPEEMPEKSLQALEHLAPDRVYPLEGSDYLNAFETNELLDNLEPIATEGKMRGIYVTEKGGTYILLKERYFQVRYVSEMNTWVIIDPANPYSFYRNLPIRLTAEGEWEPLNGIGLKGGAPSRPTVPKAESPINQYEVPVEYREELRDKELHEEGAFIGGSHNLNIAPEHFKTLRRNLIKDAEAFFEHPELPPRPPIPFIDPTATGETLLGRIYENAQGLVIGESHGDIGSKQFLIENMGNLAKRNVKTLYMEHLQTDLHQADLDRFAKTGTMPEPLEDYLREMDAGHATDPSGQYTFLELVRTARTHGVRIKGLDCMASYKLAGVSNLNHNLRQKVMNYFARMVIRADQASSGVHRWAALVGNSHSNTYLNVPGLSELQEGIGLRIEDVAESQAAGITADPGRHLSDAIGNFQAQVRGDLRLQVKSPWAWEAGQTLEQRLPKAGMFTVERATLLRSDLELIHRGRDMKIVRTRIHQENGRVSITRPTWPTISNRPFGSIQELIDALKAQGLKLAGEN